LLVAVFILQSCKEKADAPLEVEKEIRFTKEGELELLRGETDSLLVLLDIEIADTPYETQTGMMYRREMAPDQGMLFVFEAPGMHSFYMKNTLIALDIIFIDAELRIATIHKNAEPLDESGISSRVPVQYVLEVPAGMSDKWGLLEGDIIRFESSP
jgi:uncharacterized membrane protein (UPF0127 family)